MKTKVNLMLLAILMLITPMAWAAIAVDTSISLIPNPVTDPNPVTITGTILKKVPPASSADPVSGANLVIQELKLAGVGVACGTATAGWVAIANGNTNGSGQFSTSFDTTGLGLPSPGRSICFRAKPDAPSVVSGNPSPATDLVILSPVVSCTPGATIAADFASGDGTPAPAIPLAGPWVFRITVTACGALANVTAQGGANGWAPVTGKLADTGTVGVRKDTKKNQILLWTIGNMTDGQVAHLDVQVNGPIPLSTPDCQIRYLSGPWSAISSTDGGATSTKSDYTGRVTVQVDSNGNPDDCGP
jgi:hypothetical protein